MEIGLLHTHHLLVVLYAILLLAKVVVIGMGQRGLLATLNGKTKVLHIVLAAGMTLTGLALVFMAPNGLAPYMLVKYVAIVAVIVLGTIGVKRFNVVLTGLAFLGMVYAYGIAKTRSAMLTSEQDRVAAATAAAPAGDQIALGKAIYTEACARCHGPEGMHAYYKSKKLAESDKDNGYKTQIIKIGSGKMLDHSRMPAYDYLTDDQVNAVVAYINTLKK